SVAYTNPEIAWMGITEKEAKEQGIPYEKGKFSWGASGRALASGATTGASKALFDKESGRLIGAGICGVSAGEIIHEAILALEMGADAEDISKTIHAHPTLAETFAFAAEMVDGSITDAMPPKKK
ncbi:MAG: dihydrolipoyl dehydrogenase, partial [Deltaproteobacteria bacterium]|nr:dihydrolipoyl dehydrogenase [Deltaproteobacteria bacterium]